ncbi:MarR family transcriptional regulator [Halomarina salina]|uniref:MarR family transcriptional regulator n=1 Tax=Halomarina salina TaxID=1872699 RepID=A0ABD5RU83_9EURY|nr:helix-turn-helix domain-containing protein [Halomarina salina]
MSGTENQQPIPRAMIHKRILDVAESHPQIAISTIASRVSGADSELVERVLDEYGDPNQEQTPANKADPSATMSQSQTPPGADKTELHTETDVATKFGDDVGPKQLMTLEAIYEHPDASQRQLADLLDVSHSTISHRLSEIEGFDWENRWSIVKDFFEDADTDGKISSQEMGDRLDQLEQQIESLDRSPESPFKDVELAHKVIHACIESENISVEEELRILKSVAVDN